MSDLVFTWPDSATLAGIPSGRAGVQATLRLMRGLVIKAKKDAQLNTLAKRIVVDAGVAWKDWPGQVTAVQDWVRDNIMFVRDPVDLEALTDPRYLVGVGAGDCDDHSMLTAALLETIGHPCRFVAIDSDGDEVLDHVFVETRIGSTWWSVDTTEPGGPTRRQRTRLDLVEHV